MKSRVTMNVVAMLLACALVGAAPTTAPSTSPTTGAGLALKFEEIGTIHLSPDAFAKLPHQTVEVIEHNGQKAKYSGVPLHRLLDEIEVPLGPQLRGAEMTLYLIAEASDGYRVTLALAEVDPDFGDRQVIVADSRDGKPLEPKDGPFRLIVPQDARQGRWVRMLNSIEVHRPS